MLRLRHSSSSSTLLPSLAFIRFCSTTTATAKKVETKQAEQSKNENKDKEAEDPEQLLQRLRKDTDREFYEPGPVAKAMRKVVVKTTQTLGLRKKVAQKMIKPRPKQGP